MIVALLGAVLLFTSAGHSPLTPRGSVSQPRFFPPWKVERRVSIPFHAEEIWREWAAKHSLPSRNALPGEVEPFWRELGPRNIAGRVISLAFPDPTRPRFILAGSAGGGLYASDDFGVSWRQMGGDRLASLWIGALAVEPGNPLVVYAGTGEGNLSTRGYAGAQAILRSTDGGESFRTIPVPGAGAFYRIVVSQGDPSLVVAAATDGIHRSADRGVSWTRVWPTSATDLIEDPSRPGRFLAACATVFGLEGIGNMVESLDGGASWHAFGTGLPPAKQWGRAALASTDLPVKTFFLWIGRRLGKTSVTTLYRSLDDAASWEAIDEGGTAKLHGLSHWGAHLRAYGTSSGQRLLHADGYSLWRGDSAGGPISSQSPWGEAGGNFHVDTHGIDFPRSDPSLWIAATDGGVATSTDGGETFVRADQGFPTVQYYSCAIPPRDPVTVFGGSQDNALHVYRGDPGGAFESHPDLGDAGPIIIDPHHPANIVALSFAASLFGLSQDGGKTWESVYPDAMQNDPVVTIARSANDPSRIYAGGNRFYFSSDGGRTWTAVTIRSDTLPALISGLGVSPADDSIWALYEDEKIFRSTDRGITWQELPFHADVEEGTLAAGPAAGSAYVAIGTGPSQLFRTRDFGKTWTNITADLPGLTVLSILPDPRTPGRLFLGLSNGIAVSDDDGDHWRPFDAGLPNAMVTQVCLDPASSRMVAATYGRGMWELSGDLPEPTRGTIHVPASAPLPAAVHR